MKKRVISLLLCLVILSAVSPAVAIADGEDDEWIDGWEIVDDGGIQTDEGTEIQEYEVFAADARSEQILQQIRDTYSGIKTLSGRSSFNGYCGKFVNYTLQYLGINTSYVNGNGKDEFDNYKNKASSSGGYLITAYPSANYDLKSALNAISANGTKNAYNILVGFEVSNMSTNGKTYGHTCFVHAIYGGNVYYSESYKPSIGGTTYAEGAPIVCSIDTFANYYNSRCTLDGVIHFGKDEEPSYILDLNGLLDGKSSGSLGNHGTADIYINGSRVKQNVNDYYAQLPMGTKYEVRNIRPVNGYSYDGVESGTLRGTINGNTSLVLKFHGVTGNAPGNPTNIGFYNGHTYYVYKYGVSWYEAKLICEKLGGHLVTMSSAGENTYVSDLAGRDEFWIGATDRDQEGTWKWVTGESFSYSNWNTGEPNNTAGNNEGEENFAINTGGDKAVWNDDEGCKKNYFVCEFDKLFYDINIAFSKDSVEIKSGSSATVDVTFSGNNIAGLQIKSNADSICKGTVTAPNWVAYPGKCTASLQLTAAELGTTNVTFELYDSNKTVIGSKSITVKVSGYYLDLNGSLDGTHKSGITDFGRADIYINGKLIAKDSGDYYHEWPSSTSYEVKNIRALDGYKYTGNSSYSGTLDSNKEVKLPFVTLQRYTLAYDANGGTGAPASQIKLQDTTLMLSATRPTRANSSAGNYTVTLNANGGSVSTTSLSAARTTSYAFKNWNTAANGSGTSYNPGANYTVNASATLYAQWNSSTKTDVVTLPTPTRDGYTFKGWNTKSDGSGTSYNPGSYTPSGNVTLYAVWEIKTYYLDLNGQLDGKNQNNIAEIGSADIYINGTRVAQNKTDFYTAYPSGTKYEVKSIVAAEGYKYNGLASDSAPLSGTISSGSVNVRLSFSTIETYTVSFSANGGTGAPSDQIKTADKTLTLSGTKPTRADSSTDSYTVTLNANGGNVSTSRLTAARTTSYTFKNWNTKQNGSGTAYNPGGSYTVNAAATLYAQWNSSTKTATVNLPTPTREGYTFKGWGTSDSAASGVTGSYTPSGNVTLYAVWEIKKFDVSYNANGGTGVPSKQVKTYGQTLTLSNTIPSREGSFFLGWATSKNATEAQYRAGDSFTANKNTTLYAVWATPDFILPAALTAIEDDAFEGGAFAGVKLSENTRLIGRMAFADCPNLKYVYIPRATTTIDKYAFIGVEGLTILGEEGSYAQTYAKEHGFTFFAVENW